MNADTKRSREIYAEGLQARTSGLPRDANSYPTHSQEFAAWDQGWKSPDRPLEDLPPDGIPPVEAPTG